VGLIQDEDLLLTAYRQARDQPVRLSNLPRAVRGTIEKRAAGGEIREIEKKTTEDGAVYEVEIFANGREIDILVSGKGQYLGAEAEDEREDEEDDDDNDDD